MTQVGTFLKEYLELHRRIGNVGLKFGIKSTANNVVIGETTQSSSGHGLHLESRQTGRSGSARIAQIGLKNDSGFEMRTNFFKKI